MTRRDFLGAGAALAASSALAQENLVKLRIAPITLDIGKKRTVKTVAYNGQVPGPLFRWKEGQTVTVEVTNDSPEADLVHFHGFHIPAEVDGAMEEGTPMVAPHATQRYSFMVTPAGTRWYHSHIAGGRKYQSGTYTGQFGVAIVEAGNEPGAYDQDIPIVLHEWDASLGSDEEISYRYQTINGKMLGAGEPVRVKAGQRVLFRVVNASATATHRIALTAHLLKVVALDGNAVATPRAVRFVEIGPAERIDCLVEMNNPGVWIMGETRDDQRNAGLGIVIEYAGAQGAAQWQRTADEDWNYTVFGTDAKPAAVDATFPLQFKSHGDHGWTINGKSWPHADPILVKPNGRYRMLFDNQSSMAHPVHLHRHTFEVTKFVGKPVSGIFKDVVMVPGWKEVEIEFTASQPGLSLFHCHHQFHMDQGFMALVNCAS